MWPPAPARPRLRLAPAADAPLADFLLPSRPRAAPGRRDAPAVLCLQDASHYAGPQSERPICSGKVFEFYSSFPKTSTLALPPTLVLTSVTEVTESRDAVQSSKCWRQGRPGLCPPTPASELGREGVAAVRSTCEPCFPRVPCTCAQHASIRRVAFVRSTLLSTARAASALGKPPAGCSSRTRHQGSPGPRARVPSFRVLTRPSGPAKSSGCADCPKCHYGCFCADTAPQAESSACRQGSSDAHARRQGRGQPAQLQQAVCTHCTAVRAGTTRTAPDGHAGGRSLSLWL